MEWKLPESHRIFDHLNLEVVFNPALHDPRAWTWLLSGRVRGTTPPLFVQKDALNHKAEQLQGVNLHLDHPGARLQGRLVSQCAADRARELWHESGKPTSYQPSVAAWAANCLGPCSGTFFSIGCSFTFLLLHSVTGCVFSLAHCRDSVLFSLSLSHLLSLWFVSSPEFVTVSACLSFSPSTDVGLDTRLSVTQRAEGTGLATLTCDDDVHRIARSWPLIGGVSERAVASVGACTRQSHGANDEVSWGMPTSEHLSTSLEMPCAVFLVQDKFVQ